MLKQFCEIGPRCCHTCVHYLLPWPSTAPSYLLRTMKMYAVIHWHPACYPARNCSGAAFHQEVKSTVISRYTHSACSVGVESWRGPSLSRATPVPVPGAQPEGKDGHASPTLISQPRVPKPPVIDQSPAQVSLTVLRVT